MAITGGVLLLSMVFDVTVPQLMMVPAPSVMLSTMANPTMVLAPAVQAAKVNAALFVLEPATAALMSEALIISLANVV